MIVALTQVYGAKDVVYSYIYGFLFAAMPSMGAKCHYFHRISLFRGGGGGVILLTVKSDVVCRILWASTSCLFGPFRPRDFWVFPSALVSDLRFSTIAVRTMYRTYLATNPKNILVFYHVIVIIGAGWRKLEFVGN